ncbi:MAG: flagellin, partial [Alphaproteobacteria bacterium]
WLSVDSSASGYSQTKSVVSSFSRSGGVVTVGTITIDTADMKLYDANAAAVGILDGTRNATSGALESTGTYTIATIDISALTDSTADITTLEGYIQGVDTGIDEMTDAATALGSVKSRIDLQLNFVEALRDAIDRGIGQLVDADMNEESTRLQALQVQAQLGIQALSIANTSSQNILALFQ